MSTIVVLGFMLLVGLANLLGPLVSWLLSPLGVVSALLVANLAFCAVTASCPPAALMRKVCPRGRCGFD